MPDSPDVAGGDVLRALGISPVRAGIIRAARRAGGVTAQDLMGELKVSRSALAPHTRVLVSCGILLQQTDPQMAEARSGFNRLVWHVDEGALTRHLAQLSATLRPSP